MKYYAEAARVSSKYRYEGIDSLHLNKHMSAAAMLIAEDILTPKYTKEPRRQWVDEENKIRTGTWLLGFFDSLLYWEESSGKQFVEILTPTHKHGMGKLFQLFDPDLRLKVLERVSTSSNDMEVDGASVSSPTGANGSLLPANFRQTRSKRLSPGSLLFQALEKPK